MERALLCALLAFLSPWPLARAEEQPSSIRTNAARDFLPEGLAWDTGRGRFLLGSVRLHRIDTVERGTGRTRRFADAPGSVLGLQASKDGKSVWAVWTSFGTGFKENHGTGIVAWSLADARRIGAWALPDHDVRANLGDLLVLDANTIVASDSGTGAIYQFDMRRHDYRVIVAAGQFSSPQGIAAGRMAGDVYVADYDSGLWRIALADGSRTALTAPAGVELRGIDGLYRVGNGLIGVQNGTRTHRILWIALANSNAVARVEPLAQGRPEWDEPSLGVLVEGRFWFNATSQWSRFEDDLKPRADARLQPPLLDSVVIPAEAAAGR